LLVVGMVVLLSAQPVLMVLAWLLCTEVMRAAFSLHPSVVLVLTVVVWL
jgi:hypothetical protein